MKLSERFKAVIEWSLAIILVMTCIYFYGIQDKRFTPLQVFKYGERTINYGPSEIVKEEDLDGIKIYLAKYKGWYSAQAIKKNLITWSYVNGSPSGTPINTDEKINYNYGSTAVDDKKMFSIFYGYVNDKNIVKVILDVKREDQVESKEYEIDDNKMFVFGWFNNEGTISMFSRLIGVDKNGDIVYEYKYPGN
ncbi:MAG: hypothetical protein AB6733_16655 [Clostridiaceae bacterium]